MSMQVESAQSLVMTEVDEQVSSRVELAQSPVPAEVDEQVLTAGEQPLEVDKALVAQLVGEAQRQGLSVDGEGGLLAQLTKLVVESTLEGEVTAHLGYEKHERTDGAAAGNAGNGTRSKTVLTKAGPVQIDVPRDRAGTFEAMVVAKRQRRLGLIEDVVLSLSARGMTHGNIAAHLADVYGQEVFKTTISTITDKVRDGMASVAEPAVGPACVRWSSSTASTSRSGTGRSPTGRSTWPWP